MQQALTIQADSYPTPLFDVSGFLNMPGTVLLKYEPNNPTGSHKYRAARAAVRAAVECGDLATGVKALAPTGGNYGLAVAALCHNLQLGSLLVVPDNYPQSKIKLLRISGADVELVDHRLGANAHGLRATELYWTNPRAYCLLDQFSDPANIAGHEATGLEIASKVEGHQPDFLVAGIGSGASLTGIGRILKSKWRRLAVVGVQPEGCDVLSGRCTADHGIPGFAVGGPPANLDRSLIDRIESVRLEECLEMVTRTLKGGLSIGISSGANLVAAASILRSNPGAVVLTLAYDRVDSYLEQLQVPSNAGR